MTVGLVGLKSTPTAMPTGALGIWFARDVVRSPRIIIPNSIGPKLIDGNMLMASRRRFSDGFYWVNQSNNLTCTEGIAAPDGSLEATSLVGTSGTGWNLSSTNSDRVGTSKTLNGQTYTLAISVKSLSGGSLSFQFGDNNTGFATFTATTSYQRFTKTFVSGINGISIKFLEPVATGAANFAICDLELFAGPSDLNVNALTAKPGRVQNMDLDCSGETTTVIASGAFQGGSLGLIHLDQARNLNPFTFVYLTRHARTPTNSAHEAWVADASSSNNFLIGKTFNSMEGRFNQTVNGGVGVIADGAVDGSRSLDSPLWGGTGLLTFVGAARYNGTAGSQFINGVKLRENTATLTGPTVSDLVVGLVFGGGYTGYDIYAMALYNRALSDVEIVQATYGLASQSGYTLVPPRILYCQGTSISYGLADTFTGPGTDGYINNSAPNLAPLTVGLDDGVPGSHLSINGTKLDAIVSAAISNGAVMRDFVLYLEYGANDSPPTSALTAAIAAYCDARRTANPGIKIVVGTILPRNDAGDGGTAFNAGRAVHNAAVRTWVGVHCSAVSDVGGDPNVGADAAASTTTYFNPDHIHPNSAGHVIMETIARAAINSV